MTDETNPPGNFFVEVADMMAKSLIVGPYYSRAEILAALHRRFKSEAELRAFHERKLAELRALEEDACSRGMSLVMVIPAVPERMKH